MIYFETDKNTGSIIYTHFMPFDSVYGLGKSIEELQNTGVLVESLPEYSDVVPDGKIPDLRYIENEFSWVLIDEYVQEPTYDDLLSIYYTIKKGMEE